MLFAVGALALPIHYVGALTLTVIPLIFMGVASATSAQLSPEQLMPSDSGSSPLQQENEQLEALPFLDIHSQNHYSTLSFPSASKKSALPHSISLNFPAPASENLSFQPVNHLKKFHRSLPLSPLPLSNLSASTGKWKVSSTETTIIVEDTRVESTTSDRSQITIAAGKAPSLRLIPKTDYQAPPSISIGVPFAYGLSLGSVGIGLGLQERTRYTNSADGGMGISIGLGNPQKIVGFDLGISIFDLSDFASRGSISFKFHRKVANIFEVALGWQNAIVWGSTDAGSSFYGVLTKTFRLQENVNKPFSLLVVSAGVGSGQFRSESDIYKDRETLGVFGSAALRVAKPLNAIAEWTGQDMTLGLSWVPFPKTPLVLTGGVTDITGNAGDGSRLIFRLGYILSF
ncbi:MAG: hypothetical protein N3E45_13525 [Oscillatoriaceae bacterium SKW80]|nr:hypothetical protein [Oscillatoriaceae bacterium SKYG93]MCX8121820.1 hypothetical protein [Oscillatoriaceae bacterium SKW80]MDW8454580.1 hypothetical protein [Oscillatoriaceae cyanobacterium SKYGB_i_bin93]HIK27394.1 hypothetical protein [Oscillatoriaceae cyanobacterium M7585_C2015_266]